MSGHATDTQLLNARDQLRSRSFETARFIQDVAKQPGAAQHGEASLKVAVEIGKAVAQSASDAEWLNFARTGQLPDVVQLNPKQLEAVKGGLMGAVFLGLALGTLLVGGYCLLDSALNR